MAWIAQDTFVAEDAAGAQVRVQKGAPFPDDHPLVKLDRDAAEAAEKDGVSRTPLFAPMNFGEPEPEPAPEPEPEPAPAPAKEAAAPRKGAATRKGT
jgi:hypothetical protein